MRYYLVLSGNQKMIRFSRFNWWLILLFILIFLIPSYGKSSLLPTDSLSYCGYFDQEISLRKRLLAEKQLTETNRQAEQIFLRIAELNYNQKINDKYDYESEFKSIIQLYRKSSQSVRNKTAIEIGRLIALDYSKKNNFEDCLVLFKKLLVKTKKDPIRHASLNLNIGQVLLNGQRKYYEAIPYFKAAKKGFEDNGMGNHYINALAVSDLSFAYDRGEIEQEMMACSEKAHHIWTTYYAKDAEIVSNSYNNLLSDVIDYGDHFLAKKYQEEYDEYIQKYLKEGKENYLSQSNEYNTLSLYYLSAIRYFSFNFNKEKILNALDAQEKLFARAPADYQKKEKSVLLSSYDNVCYAFYTNYDAKNALYYNLIMEQKADDDFYKMKAEANRAMLHYYNYNYPKALIHNLKSLNFLELLGFKSSYKTLLTLKAELQANLGLYTDAKNTLTELFELIFKKGFKYQSLNIKDYKEVASSSDINILIHAGLAYKVIYEKNGKKKEDLKVMKNFYSIAAKMFKVYYQKGYFNPTLDSQLGNIKEGLMYGVVQDPSDVLYATNSINAIENNESQHLWKEFLMKNSQNVRVPKELLDQRNSAKLEVNYLESLSEITTEDSAKLVLEIQKLNIIEEKIKVGNPLYDRYSTFDFDIKKLQSRLSENEVILKFIVTDSTVFGMKISSNNLALKYLGKRTKLEDLSSKYYKALSALNFDYTKKSNALYGLLIEPLELSQNSKIRIITEGFLNYLPFETLQDDKNDFLAQNHIISYANGLKFLNSETQEKNKRFGQHFSGFAPEYGLDNIASRGENGNLVYTGKELQKIANTLGGGSIYLKNEATKSNFLESIGQSNIHHLAMHSLLDQNDYNYSSLVFQNDEKLYFKDLYNLNFPSEMVVLSACNTGIGQLLSGEGLMSMSRALNYAGVKSTVYSLWQVPDKETSDLMVLFYENIENGLDKDDALAEAKRTFLTKYSAKSHPYFWAGFVVNGDLNPINRSTNILKIAMVAFAIFGFLFLLKRWLFPDLKLFK